jgi:YVTN family beta-propeller protein
VGGAWWLGLLVVAGGWTLAAAQPFAYVTQPAASTVAVINTAINSVVATIPVASPQRIAVTPDGALAYVTQDSADTVTVLDTATGRVVATIPVAFGGSGGEVAVTPDGAFVYVTGGIGSNPGLVTVLDTATQTVAATIPVGSWPLGVVIAPDGSAVYVVNFFPEDVTVIATESHTVVATVNVGSDPFGIAITPDGAFLYVGSANQVDVLATAPPTLVTSVRGAGNPFWVFVTPDGAFAYVDSGAVLETTTHTVVGQRDLPSAWAAFTPDGTRGYLLGGGGVAVLDPKLLTVASTIPLSHGPGGVAIPPGGIAIPAAPAPVGTGCPEGAGFWKTHADAWPLPALTLGSQTYTQAELLAVLNTPARGDASVILATQLLAAKLNVAAGADPTPIRAALQEADRLLSQGVAGKLPYRVGPSSPMGRPMVDGAAVFASYNDGDLIAACPPVLVSAR